MKSNNVVIILNCDQVSKEDKNLYGDSADQAIALMKKNDVNEYISSYEAFECFDNKFPTLEYLREGTVVGIFITGSVYDSFSNAHEWIINLRSVLTTILTSSKHSYPPIFAVCFGHQIVAKCLGIETKRNPRGPEIGIKRIALNETLDVEIFDSKKSFHIVETHTDIVTGIPQGYSNVGSTSLCDIQGLYQKGKLLTLQGHPEFSNEILIKIMQETFKNGGLTEKELNDKIEETNRVPNDGPNIGRCIIKLFTRVI